MTQTDLRTTIEYIESRLSRDAYSEVIAHCRHVLDRYPKSLDAYRMLARALVEQEKHTDAMDLFQRILSADPNDFVAHVGISECYREANALEAAIWHLERAFEQVPNNAGLQDEIRRLYEIKGLKAPRKIRLTSGALARLYAKGNLYPQAIKELEKAITEDPERLDLQTLLADVLWRSNNVVQAGRVAGEVIKRLPYSIDANRILALLWLRAGKPQEALPFINRVRECDPYLAYRLEHSGREAPSGSVVIDAFDFVASHKGAVSADAEWVADLDQLGSIQKQKGVTGPLAGASITDVFHEDTPPGAPSVPATSSEEKAPDWLQSALRGTAGLHSPGAAPNQTEIDALLAAAPAGAPGGGDPDWLVGLFDEGPGAAPAGATPAAGLPAPDLDAPDWLREATAGAPSTSPASQPPVAASPGNEPDWLRDVLSEETPPGLRLSEPPARASGRTGLLAALKAADPNEQAPDWLLESAQISAPGGAPPAAQEGSDTPGWLLDAMATGAHPRPESSDEPEWMRNPEDVTGAWPQPAPPSDDSPDWLREAAVSPGSETPVAASDSWLDDMLRSGPDLMKETPPLGFTGTDAPETGSVPRVLIGGLETWDDDSEALLPAKPGDRDAMPDWLRDVAEVDQIAGSGENKQTGPQPASPDADDMPDWLRAGVSPAEALPSAEKLSEPDTQEDLPDWLKGGEAAPATAPSAPVSVGVTPPAQEGAVSMSDEPEKMDIDWDSDDALAWLEELAAELDPNFKASGAGDAPEAEAEAEPLAAVESDETPEWLKSGPESAVAAPAAASAADEEEEEGLPDWLVSDSPAAKAPASTEAAAEDLPDWLKGGAEPARAEAAASEDDLAWLRAPEEPAKPAASSEDEGLPEWLTGEPARAVSEPAKAVSEPVKAVSEPVKAESDPLAWLDEKVAEQGVAKDAVVSEALSPDRPPVSTPAVPPPDARAEAPSDEDLPDWLKGVDTEAAIASAPAERAREPELDIFSEIKVEDEELDWLNESLPDKVGEDVDLDALFGKAPAAASKPAAAEDEGLPAWLTGEEKPAPASASKPAAAEEEMALPAWLAGDDRSAAADEGLPAWLAGEEKPAPAVASKPAAAEEEEALPAWLAGDDRSAAADEGLPAWLTGEEKPAPAVASKPAAAEEVEALPAWLAGESEKEDAGLPAWLAGETAAEVSREMLMPRAEEPVGAVPSEAPAPAGPERLPSWAAESAETTDAGLESFLRAAEPAAPAPVAPPAPLAPSAASVTPPPVPASAPPVSMPRVTGLLPEPPAPFSGDFAAQLSRARSEMEQGNKVPSLLAYDSLVGAGQMLDEVVEDLNALIAKGPVDSKVHRMLGDALMSRGRLQDALDQYRRALDQL